MAITAKPSGWSLKSTNAYTPTHLWLFSEGSGTNASDTGSGTAFDATLQNSAMWATDGTHGPVITCSASPAYYATTGSGTVWVPASGSILLVAIVKTVDAVAPAVAEYAFSCGRTDNNNNHASLRNPGIASNGALQGWVRDATTTAQVNASDFYDATWRMIAMKGRTGSSQINVAASTDGEAWNNDTTTTISFASNPNFYSIGARAGASGNTPFDGQIAAVWAIENGTWADWDDAYIAALYNSGNPWSMFLESAAPTILAPNKATLSV